MADEHDRPMDHACATLAETRAILARFDITAILEALLDPHVRTERALASLKVFIAETNAAADIRLSRIEANLQVLIRVLASKRRNG